MVGGKKTSSCLLHRQLLLYRLIWLRMAVAPSFWRGRPTLEGSLLWESVRLQMIFGFMLMCLRVSWYRASSVSNTQTTAAPMHESQKLTVFASGSFFGVKEEGMLDESGRCRRILHGDADLCFSGETIAGCVLPNWFFLRFYDSWNGARFIHLFLLSMIPCNYY